MPQTANSLLDTVIEHADLQEFLRRDPPVSDEALDNIIDVLRAERTRWQLKKEK